MSGVLILVVGPSGAGKDTLIAGAREALFDDRRFVFPTRFITRGGDAGGEAHMPLEPQEFEDLKEGGFFAVSWDAHGLRYGIPGGIVEDLARGRNVVVNVSRSVIDQVGRRFERTHVIKVTAAPHILAERLRARGREPLDDVASRLARAEPATPEGVPVSNLANDGSVESGIRSFVAALESAIR